MKLHTTCDILLWFNIKHTPTNVHVLTHAIGGSPVRDVDDSGHYGKDQCRGCSVEAMWGSRNGGLVGWFSKRRILVSNHTSHSLCWRCSFMYLHIFTFQYWLCDTLQLQHISFNNHPKHRIRYFAQTGTLNAWVSLYTILYYTHWLLTIMCMIHMSRTIWCSAVPRWATR